MNEKYIQDKLNALSKSKFRSSFHLKKKDIEYIDKKGINTIKSHAFDFIEKRIAPQYIKTMENKHQLKTTLYSSLSMLQQHAAEIVYINGTIYKKINNLIKKNKNT